MIYNFVSGKKHLKRLPYPNCNPYLIVEGSYIAQLRHEEVTTEGVI